jgi:hypothetical protein
MTSHPQIVTDEIVLDPFERRHLGTHGAFTLRVNRKHVERCVRHILSRQLDEVEIEFGHGLSVVPSRKRAA